MNAQQLSEAMKLMCAKGGKARAEKLTHEQLSEIGKKCGRPRIKKFKKSKKPKSR